MMPRAQFIAAFPNLNQSIIVRRGDVILQLIHIIKPLIAQRTYHHL